MSRIDEDDYFKDSTMSFGEHLEELRKCLIRAILGLVVGFLIGLLIGGNVVQVIQSPLKTALKKFYQGRSLTAISTDETVFHSHGYGADIATLPDHYGLTSEKLMVNPAELAIALGIDPATLPQQVPFKDPLTAAQKTDSAASADPANPAQNPENQGFLERWKQWIVAQFEEKDIDLGEDVSKTAEDEKTQKDLKAAGVAEETTLVPIYVWRKVDSDPRAQVRNFAVQETFMIYVKASLLAGIILASPWIFWQIWSFIAAGLYPNEKRYVHIFLPFSLVLFLGGAFLAFFFVFTPVLEFLFSFNTWMGIEPDPRISEWLNFFLILPIGFGISFQLPLVMLFLERIGVATTESYAKYWRAAILAIFVISMILTPADPYSMILMAIPLSFLYLGGIMLCKMLPRKKNPYALED